MPGQTLCKFLLFTVFGLLPLFSGIWTIAGADAPKKVKMTASGETAGPANGERQIVLAGGCFWGVQEYFSRVPGVLATRSGYAQSTVPNPSYEAVCGGKTNAAEAVLIDYDPKLAPLELLLRHFFQIIDPTAVNRQGNDIGSQYRTGIFYTDPEELKIISQVLQAETARVGKPLAVLAEPLRNFYKAEDYHQDYLKKNPAGYCHISFASLSKPELQAYVRPPDEKLKASLSADEYYVTRQNGTEPPFSGKYNDFDEPGIYVDVISGQPLFTSRDKFKSSCGWPAFSAPITGNALTARRDLSHGMDRVEVRSSLADSHLGHVFNDGPKEKGGMRFCVNSASLRFVPLKDMDRDGYGAYKKLVENK